MNSIKNNLHTKVHNWMDSIGFQLNGSQTSNNETTNHYFFETFNFFEQAKSNDLKNPRFLCFDTYGETIKVKSLLDMQSAFYENISQIK